MVEHVQRSLSGASVLWWGSPLLAFQRRADVDDLAQRIVVSGAGMTVTVVGEQFRARVRDIHAAAQVFGHVAALPA